MALMRSEKYPAPYHHNLLNGHTLKRLANLVSSNTATAQQLHHITPMAIWSHKTYLSLWAMDVHNQGLSSDNTEQFEQAYRAQLETTDA